ncbi:MAG: hypothetical protein Q8R37_03860 [Nanoarchaeota archaeon]|nr:hypothetical protein [Nanoarchaeota archaeon]
MTNIEGRVLKIEGMSYRHKPRFMVECRLGNIRTDNLWIKTTDGQCVFEEHGKELDTPLEVWDPIETIIGSEYVIPAVERYFTQGHPGYESIDAIRARRKIVIINDVLKSLFEVYVLREEK